MPTGWKQCEAPKGKRPNETNFGRIMTMSLDEFAKINNYAYEDCLIRVFNKGKEVECPAMKWREDDEFCNKCLKQWLKRESEV